MEKQLSVMSTSSASEISSVLEALAASGSLKISDLYPSLNRVLSDGAAGGFAGRVFAGEVRNITLDQVIPQEGNEDPDPVDVIEVKDVAGSYNGDVFNYYATNGGMKAKARVIRDFKYIVIMFKGEVPNEKKGFNAWKDYLLIGTQNKDEAVAACKALEDAVKRGKK